MLRPGGRLAFYTIHIAPGLSERDYGRALRLASPRVPRVASRRREQQELLGSAGFVGISESDLTAEFLRTARGWLAAREQNAAELGKSEGEAQFAQKRAEDRAQIKAIEAGLLRRALFVAERPG